VGGTSTDSDRGSSSNCQLIIHPLSRRVFPNQNSTHVTSVTIELIARSNLKTGDTLRLNIPPAGSRREMWKLYKELQRTGQPFYKPIFEQLSNTNAGKKKGLKAIPVEHQDEL
jgi:hypothetical protein